MEKARPGVSGKQMAGRVAEFVLLFGGLPLLYMRGWIPIPLLLLLFFVAAGCGLTLSLDSASRHFAWFRLRVSRREWGRVLILFALAAPLLIAAAWLIRHGAIFEFPRERFRTWILFLLLYPLISVVPQEVVFRAFFFRRYSVLFGSGGGLILASALAFGFAHLAYHNWVAVALTVPAGMLFARSYQRTGSILFVACEHTLYGCFVFTIGFGEFLCNSASASGR